MKRLAIKIRKIVLYTVILAQTQVFLISCGNSKHGALNSNNAVQAPPTRVSLQVLKFSYVNSNYEAVGKIQAAHTGAISPKIMGRILDIFVKEGQKVQSGEIVATLDNKRAGTQLVKAMAEKQAAQYELNEAEEGLKAQRALENAAQARVALTRATFARYSALLKSNSVSRQEYDEVKDRYKEAQANLDRARWLLASLSYKNKAAEEQIARARADILDAQIISSEAKIRAPFSGTVAKKMADVGDMALPGKPILTIQNHDYQLEVSVGQSMIGKIHLNEKVPLEIGPANQKTIGTVVKIAPDVDPQTQSFAVWTSIPPSRRIRSLLHPGLYGKAFFFIGRKRALLIPREAVVANGELTSVFIVGQNHKARMRMIQTGGNYDGHVEVLSGLEPGDTIIIKGTKRLHDGSTVGD